MAQPTAAPGLPQTKAGQWLPFRKRACKQALLVLYFRQLELKCT